MRMALITAVHRPDVGVEGPALVGLLDKALLIVFCPGTGVGGITCIVGTVCKSLHVAGSFSGTITGLLSVKVSEAPLAGVE